MSLDLLNVIFVKVHQHLVPLTLLIKFDRPFNFMFLQCLEPIAHFFTVVLDMRERTDIVDVLADWPAFEWDRTQI